MRRLTLTTANASIGTSAKDFFRWWGGELKGMLPARLRADGTAARPCLVIRSLGRNELRCEVYRGDRSSPLGPLPGAAVEPDARNAFMAELAGCVDDLDGAVLVLDESQVLRTELQLPSSVAEDLRAVLGFEMGEYTPFRADQVYFDFRILDRSAETLDVELLTVPRRSLDPLIDRIGALGIRLAAVVGAGAHDVRLEPARQTLNLLPAASRTRRDRSQGAVNRMLAAAVAILAVGAAVVPLAKLQIAENALTAESRTARMRADEAMELRDQLSSRAAELQAVMQRRRAEPAVVEVLGELADILPDHTFLRTLELSNGTLRIQGESSAASELIGLIEESPLFEGASFVSPVTRNPGSSQERFQISTTVAAKG